MRTKIESARDGVPKNKKPGKNTRATQAKMKHSANVCVCVCACVRERERQRGEANKNSAYAPEFTHTSTLQI